MNFTYFSQLSSRHETSREYLIELLCMHVYHPPTLLRSLNQCYNSHICLSQFQQLIHVHIREFLREEVSFHLSQEKKPGALQIELNRFTVQCTYSVQAGWLAYPIHIKKNFNRIPQELFRQNFSGAIPTEFLQSSSNEVPPRMSILMNSSGPPVEEVMRSTPQLEF